MAEQSVFETPSGRKIAYHFSPGQGPGVVFLGGFMSDMGGTKAVHLEAWCRAQGRAFLRFDYSGHGQSSGAFRDGSIGDWADDAADVIAAVTSGPQVLVGSSMGGWIACLLAREGRIDVAGMVTIAGAPDFTEDGFWAGFSDDERARLATEGVVEVPSDYGAPHPITKRLIEEGREVLVLRSPLRLPFPVRLLQGDQDEDVSVETCLKLFSHAEGSDIRMVLLKGADHRFSAEDALRLTEDAIADVLEQLS